MNKDTEKAERLWRHLKIQDEHLLIRVSNPGTNTERVLIVCDEGSGGLQFAYAEIPPNGFNKWIMEYGQPFTLVQQRNEDGCFYIPDIDEWLRDEEIDY
jgi:hypothetical protein